MSIVISIVVMVLFGWFFGKLSKTACALTGFFGLVIAVLGHAVSNFSLLFFGFGLFLFSALVFVAYNGID